MLLQHVADLTGRISQLHKENKAPSTILSAHIQKTNQRSILNTNQRRTAAQRRAVSIFTNGLSAAADMSVASSTNATTSNSVTDSATDESHADFHKRLSMVDVSGMLLDFYKANVAKAPKTQQQQLQLKYRQTSPTSAETNEPSTIAAIATNGAAEAAKASKNLMGGEMPIRASSSQVISNNIMKSMAFHPRIKYSKNFSAANDAGNKEFVVEKSEHIQVTPTILTAIPTSVVVPTSPQIDVKPIINPTTGLVMEPIAMTASVIKQVPSSNIKATSATAIAAALLQRQLAAQELQREGEAPSKILQKLLSQQRQDNASNTNAHNESADDDYEERYNGFDDIHLTEDSKQSNYGASTSMPNIFQTSMATGSGHNLSDVANNGEYFSTQSQKLLIAQAQAQAMRNLEYSLNEFEGNLSGNRGGTSPHNESDASGEAIYECGRCFKKYRWKSTLRRHEMVECGGKEPAHQCPYCSYKSKQRGNLGVHVRKHHSDLPQLASKRRSKYSQSLDNGQGGASNGSFSANVSDDDSKLVIDFSKCDRAK